METREILPCPCGQTPKELHSVDNGQGGKWAMVYGDCCGEWHVEYRTEYKDLESPEGKEIARVAWNFTPRAKAAALPEQEPVACETLADCTSRYRCEDYQRCLKVYPQASAPAEQRATRPADVLQGPPGVMTDAPAWTTRQSHAIYEAADGTPTVAPAEQPSQDLDARLSSSAIVIGNLPELPGYNGSILQIDDAEAARVAMDIDEAAQAITDLRAQLAEQEGYPGIAHDFETAKATITRLEAEKWEMRELLAQIKLESIDSDDWSGRFIPHTRSKIIEIVDGRTKL